MVVAFLFIQLFIFIRQTNEVLKKQDTGWQNDAKQMIKLGFAANSSRIDYVQGRAKWWTAYTIVWEHQAIIGSEGPLDQIAKGLEIEKNKNNDNRPFLLLLLGTYIQGYALAPHPLQSLRTGTTRGTGKGMEEFMKILLSTWGISIYFFNHIHSSVQIYVRLFIINGQGSPRTASEGLYGFREPQRNSEGLRRSWKEVGMLSRF